MKKYLLILVAVIGFGFSANAQCSEYTCSCGATLYSSSQAYLEDCYNCGGDGLITGNCERCEPCSACEQTGKQKCQGWQSCRSCGGTGCKDGYTTNNGKNCAYGHCNSCQGKGGKYVTDRWKNCANCSGCGGHGWRNVLKSNHTGCSSCGGNSQHEGTGKQWHSGCKCPSCGKGYK